MTSLFDPMAFQHGPAQKNRFALAPLTNLQSHKDGTLSDDEFRWLTLRAKGGFGMTMTCASHVQAVGLGFPGQLGIFGDEHIEGLTRLAAAIRAENSLAIVQLHHAGMRSPEAMIGTKPVCPSDNAETGARGLSLPEVEQLRDDFIAAAIRAEKAGFDGVELHGAHGYILCQFISAETNRRTDRYGGDIGGRARIVDEIIDGIRVRCRPGFNLGIRLSPERFGLKIGEMKGLVQRLMTEAKVDYIDMSLWDTFKEPEEPEFKGHTLLAHFAGLDRGKVRLGVAGKISTGTAARAALDGGADFVLVGRSAILHHDFPKKVAADPAFTPIALPVAAAHLEAEGLGPAFLNYMRSWKGFVAEA
jgi:2,4-dienoyl-CoA reductase-like NADH-dependent reductase (Old Yellow Enzyme family)